MKAIVLLSGGLDSTVMLAGIADKRQCIAITFAYQQRNHYEIEAAKRISDYYNIQHKQIAISPAAFARSSLLAGSQTPVKDRTSHHIHQGGIPSTYVPGRNTLFLAYAIGQAEIHDAQEIYIGANRADSSGYPDARPAYLQAFQNLLNLATKQAIEGAPPQIIAPLLSWDKKEIVKQGLQLKAPLHLTMSCYDPTQEGSHCGRCDACYLRKEGFLAIRKKDPTVYAQHGLPLGAAELSDMPF